jgi:hypothetical protein
VYNNPGVKKFDSQPWERGHDHDEKNIYYRLLKILGGALDQSIIGATFAAVLVGGKRFWRYS